jgi:hypothetical protein
MQMAMKETLVPFIVRIMMLTVWRGIFIDEI